MVSHHSRGISVAILLLKNHQNEAEYNIMILFKKIPIGLKENLREEDNKGQLARSQCVLCSEVLMYSPDFEFVDSDLLTSTGNNFRAGILYSLPILLVEQLSNEPRTTTGIVEEL